MKVQSNTLLGILIHTHANIHSHSKLTHTHTCETQEEHLTVSPTRPVQEELHSNIDIFLYMKKMYIF